MYFLKTCKKPFNHLEYNCVVRLTNCVLKFLCSGFNGQSEIMAVLRNAALLRKWYTFSALATGVFPLTRETWIASNSI